MVELHELRLPDLERAVKAGRGRMMRRGPRALSEILSAAAAEMDERDLAEAYAREQLLWLRARPPRRTLWDRLFR